MQLRDELAQWGPGGTVTAISVSVVVDGDSLQVRFAPRATDAGSRVVRIARANYAAIGPVLREVAIHMHGGRPTFDLPDVQTYAGRSRTAVRSYASGYTFLLEAQFDSAVMAFEEALVADPTLAAADYWRALASYWRAPTQPVVWRPPHAGAQERDSLLTLRTRAASDMMAMQFAKACPAWREAVAREPDRFDAWYMLGRCQQLDSVVLAVPAGLYFRQSSWQALRSYGIAVQLAPTAPLLHALMGPVWRASFAGGSEVRAGRSEDGRRAFYAMPGESDDTLTLVPVPLDVFRMGGREAVPESWTRALRRGRSVMLDFTQTWVQRFPEAPEAWWHHARALELLGRVRPDGDGEAGGALARARALRSGPLRDDMAVMTIRLALRREEFSEAARLATSYLASAASRGERTRSSPRHQAVAALLGDTAWLRGQQPTPVSGGRLPVALDEALARLTLSGQTGDCEETSRARDEAERLLVTVAPAQRREVADTWLRSALRIAVPCLGPAVLRAYTPVAPMDSVYRALADGDRRRARLALEHVQQRRKGASTAALTWDYIYAEAWALAATGDTTAAIAHVTAALDDIAGMSLYTIEDPGQSAGLRRALALLVAMRDRSAVPVAGLTQDREAQLRAFLELR
ncbi:MAG: hypothetical protein MUF00_19985 [Gemmatimonadaceae bacterium]|nr:hypothetical protein [Gemmatimonadaceae bacterium]